MKMAGIAIEFNSQPRGLPTSGDVPTLVTVGVSLTAFGSVPAAKIAAGQLSEQQHRQFLVFH